MIPILFMPPPWAWATIAGFRYTHGVAYQYLQVPATSWRMIASGGLKKKSLGDRTGFRGPAAVVATNTNYGVAQAMQWMRESGVDVPKKLHKGAMVGVVDVAACVRRSQVPEYLFLDEHPWQLVLLDPLALRVPVCSKRMKPKVGLPIEEALAALAGHRSATGRAYTTKLRELMEAR